MVGAARYFGIGWAALLLLSLSRVHARIGDSLASWVVGTASRQFSRNETAAAVVAVPNEFIVIFSENDEEPDTLDHDAVEQRAALVARLLGARILYIYHYTFQGVALAVDSNKTSSAATRTTTEPVLTLSRARSILSRAQTRRHGLFRGIEEVWY
jgi:hypothetical protein